MVLSAHTKRVNHPFVKSRQALHINEVEKGVLDRRPKLPRCLLDAESGKEWNAEAIALNYRVWHNMGLALGITADCIPLDALRLKGIWGVVLST